MRGKISKVDMYIFDLTTIMVSIKTYIIIIKSSAMKLVGGWQLKLKNYGTLTEQRNWYCN